MSDTGGFDDDLFGKDDGLRDSMIDASSSATVGVIKVKKLEYAVGLLWETVSDVSRAVQTAKERANNAEYYCIYNAGVTQFGLGEKRLGHKPNMPSLAAHIAATRTGQFLALFEVPGGYYILGVRHDGINSQLERFISDRQEAAELFEDYNSLTWEEKIAPKSFGWVDANEISIEDCLQGRPPVRLKEVNSRSNLLKIGLVVILIIVAILGWQQYQKIKADEEAAAALEQMRQQAAEVTGMGEPEIIVPAPEWDGKVPGVVMLDSCARQIEEFPLDVPGWKVESLVCNNPADPQIQAGLTRKALGDGGGPVTWIEEYVKTFSYTPKLATQATLTGSSDQVAVVWNVFEGTDVPKYTADTVTISVGKVKGAFLKVFEERMTPIRFGETAVDPKFYNGFSFDFTTKTSPTEFDDILSSVPGLVLDEVRFSLEDKTWSIKGNVYEQLPLPKNAKIQ